MKRGSFLSCAVAAMALALPAASAAQQRGTMTEPEVGQDSRVFAGKSMIETVPTLETRSASGRVLGATVNQKYMHVSRKVRVDAGTPLVLDKGDWFCTQRDNYYAGGGRHGKMCFLDKDGDGAFERMRMNRALIKAKLSPPVPWSELQSMRDVKTAEGLKKSVAYVGTRGDLLVFEYREYYRAPGSPTVRREFTAKPGPSRRINLMGVDIEVILATPDKIEFRRLGGDVSS